MVIAEQSPELSRERGVRLEWMNSPRAADELLKRGERGEEKDGGEEGRRWGVGKKKEKRKKDRGRRGRGTRVESARGDSRERAGRRVARQVDGIMGERYGRRRWAGPR
jgi:hypothetical protein